MSPHSKWDEDHTQISSRRQAENTYDDSERIEGPIDEEPEYKPMGVYSSAEVETPTLNRQESFPKQVQTSAEILKPQFSITQKATPQAQNSNFSPVKLPTIKNAEENPDDEVAPLKPILPIQLIKGASSPMSMDQQQLGSPSKSQNSSFNPNRSPETQKVLSLSTFKSPGRKKRDDPVLNSFLSQIEEHGRVISEKSAESPTPPRIDMNKLFGHLKNIDEQEAVEVEGEQKLLEDDHRTSLKRKHHQKGPKGPRRKHFAIKQVLNNRLVNLHKGLLHHFLTPDQVLQVKLSVPDLTEIDKHFIKLHHKREVISKERKEYKEEMLQELRQIKAAQGVPVDHHVSKEHMYLHLPHLQNHAHIQIHHPKLKPERKFANIHENRIKKEKMKKNNIHETRKGAHDFSD